MLNFRKNKNEENESEEIKIEKSTEQVIQI